MGLARRRFRHIPGKEGIFEGLTVESGSREAKLKLARRFLKAWASADTAWELNLLGGSVGFTTYQNQRRTIEGDDSAAPPVPGLGDALAGAEQTERREAEKLRRMLEALEGVMEQWYADATAACPAGTAEGDQIRGQVPTTYDPSHEPTPIPPTPSGLAVQAGPETGSVQAVCLPATWATQYVWTAALVSDPTQVFQMITTEPAVLLTGLPAAVTVSVTVAAQNGTGISAASAPVPAETAP